MIEMLVLCLLLCIVFNTDYFKWIDNMLELNERQKIAVRVLNSINIACSLNTILSRSSGAFGSKALLKTILLQLVSFKIVTLQSNGYYKITPECKKNSTMKIIKAPVTSKVVPDKKVITEPEINPSINDDIILDSLDSFAKKLKKSIPEIERAVLKLKVLDKLSRILDPEIGDVLDEIHTDLSKVISIHIK